MDNQVIMIPFVLQWHTEIKQQLMTKCFSLLPPVKHGRPTL